MMRRWRCCASLQFPSGRGNNPRRSREMTHLCSFKVTHTKNTIWRRARISEAISSTPQACGVVFHHPRRSVRKVPIFYEEFRAQVKPINRRDRGGGLATDLPAGKKPFLPGGKTATLSAWCWVAFGEQTMVISRECRSVNRQRLPKGRITRIRRENGVSGLKRLQL